MTNYLTTARVCLRQSEKMDDRTWKNKLKFPHLASLILPLLLAIVLILTHNTENMVHPVNPLFQEEEPTPPKNDSVDHQGCNLFSGRWVFDNISYPLYKERECSFMDIDFACERYGRKDLKYQNWRWQPRDCDLLRFNGTVLMEKLRGKKLVYVGDSLNRNQWKSMLCLVDYYLPPSPDKRVTLEGNLYSFHSTEYNATIGFYWSPTLVESNCDDIKLHRVWPRVVRINSIEKYGREWVDADILVFDSFAWWMSQNMTLLWGSFESPDAIVQHVENKLRRYEMALNTWSDWVEMQINTTRTKLFFTSFSPYRIGVEDAHTIWGTDDFCYGKTEPELDETYWPTAVDPEMMRVVESVIEKLGTRGVKVQYLNITQLSGYREDAHQSTYRIVPHNLEKLIAKNPRKYIDCLHWCLPGVPDVWNQILYDYIIRS